MSAELSRAHVADAAIEAGLGSWADWLSIRALPSLRLTPQNESSLATGSHLGGNPRLPDDFEWPTWRGVPMSFIAQIDLSELGANASAFGLPSTGVLTFFYDSRQSTWGFDPADADSALVAWWPDTDLLRSRTTPESRFKRVDVSFRSEWTVPQFGSLELAWDKSGRGVPADQPGEPVELESMLTLENLLAGEDHIRHRMFGHPDQIQNEMRTECELVTNGISTGNSSYVAHPRYAELEANGGEWRLLLQVDSDDRLGSMWGDGGRIYFWIRQDALRDRAFDRAWLILQCG